MTVERGLNGTYVRIEPFHLFRYLDERSFRYNNRKNMDGSMDDKQRSEPQSNGDTVNSNSASNAHTLNAQASKCSNTGAAPQSKCKKEEGYWKKLAAEKPDRHIELFLTFAIMFFAATQLIISCNNNKSTSNQVNKIIIAADRIDDAAGSFSRSASGISSGVSDAVTQLGNQATNSKDFATLTKEQFAKDQRPYLWKEVDEKGVEHVGEPRFELVYPDLSIGEISIDLWLKNYGKSPALEVRSLAYISDGPGGEDDVDWTSFPQEGGGIYPPGGAFSKTARTRHPVSRSAMQFRPITDLKTPNLWAIHILVKYSDQNGNRYSSEICTVVQANGVSKRCKKNNHMY